MDFNTLCLGGGSIRGLCELGALHYFVSEGILDLSKINTFAGTSVGSVIALLLAVGYAPMDILIHVMKVDAWMDFEVTDILQFREKGGILDLKNLIKNVEELILKKMHFIPTLKELFEMKKKKLVVCATNVTRHRCEYFDFESEPELSCIDAITMSCSMPVIFKRFEYKDCYYVDGGLLDNFPIDVVNCEGSKILGICIEGMNTEDDGFFNYIYTVFTLPTLSNQRCKITHLPTNCSVLNIIVNGTPPIDFKMAKELKMDMFIRGHDAAEAFSIEQFWKDFDF